MRVPLKHKALAGYIALAASPLISIPTIAQENALEEVVVTARYREENLQVAPLAITAITAEEIEARSFASSSDIALSIPNASFRPAQAAFGNTMSAYIRGIGQNDFDFAFEPGVGVYIDDIYHPTTMGSMMDLMDLERVEVLRGPQGTLFGRGSLGGAIRLVSKKPTGDNSGSIQVTAGDFDRKDLRASFDFAITDSLFARVSAVSKSRDGYQDRIDFTCANPGLAGTIPDTIGNRRAGCKLGTNGGEEVDGFRAALLWQATEDLEIQYTIDEQDDQSEARANTLLAANVAPPYTAWDDLMLATYGVRYDDRFVPDDPYVSYATFSDPLTGRVVPAKTSLKSGGWSLKGNYNINDQHSLSVIYSRRDFNSLFGNDHDVSPLNIQQVDGIQEMDSETFELRFSGLLFDERMEYTAGAFLYRGEVISSQQVIFPGLLVALGAPYPAASDGILVDGFIENEAEHDSLFAHVVYDLTDQLSLTVGGRWSDDSKYSDFTNSIVSAIVDTSDDRMDWKLGLDYQINDDIMVYVSAASGYRPEAYNPRPFQVTQFVGVDGEEAVSYDLGIKGDFLEGTLRVNATLFYIDYKQRITAAGGTECVADSNGNYTDIVPVGTPGALTDNLGQTCLTTTSRTFYVNTPGEVDGFEIETAWSPIENLTLSAIYGFTGWDSDDITGAQVTDTPANVPESNYSVSASYDFYASDGTRITPRIDLYYQDEICSAVNSLNSCSESYDLVNTRVEWNSADQTWTAALGLNNATDEEYFLNRFDGSAFGQPYVQGQPGRPKEWYMTVGKQF